METPEKDKWVKIRLHNSEGPVLGDLLVRVSDIILVRAYGMQNDERRNSGSQSVVLVTGGHRYCSSETVDDISSKIRDSYQSTPF